MKEKKKKTGLPANPVWLVPPPNKVLVAEGWTKDGNIKIERNKKNYKAKPSIWHIKKFKQEYTCKELSKHRNRISVQFKRTQGICNNEFSLSLPLSPTLQERH